MKNNNLPQICYHYLQSLKEIVIIENGTMGYYKSELPAELQTQERADVANADLGITKAQQKAMVGGSMFGWDSDLANPENYNKNGKLKESVKKVVRGKYNGKH